MQTFSRLLWKIMSVQYLIPLNKKENKPRTRPLEYIQISYDKEAHFLSCEIMNTKYHYLFSITQICSHNLFIMSLSWSLSSTQDSTKETWTYRKEVKEGGGEKGDDTEFYKTSQVSKHI